MLEEKREPEHFVFHVVFCLNVSLLPVSADFLYKIPYYEDQTILLHLTHLPQVSIIFDKLLKEEIVVCVV